MEDTSQDPRVDNVGDGDSTVDQLPSLSLDLDDKKITKNLDELIQDSKDYWEKAYKLKKVREQNVKYHLGQHVDTSQLYKHQIPYVENEIFVGVESILAYVSSQTPQSEVAPGGDSIGSKVLAQDLQKYHVAHSTKFGLPMLVEASVRNMLLKRIGLIGLRYDPGYGKHGEIIPEIIDPEHVVIDKSVRLGKNPAFIRINRECSTEELVSRFPAKKDDIYKELGIQRGTAKQMSQQVVYHEVWFTDFSTGEAVEAVCWYMGGLVLDKSKDPNWLHGVEGDNFLDAPMKPFIPFNFINDGSKWIDQTTPVEQAGPLQDILNRRGRQIMENADHANPKEVYSGKAMSKDDAENITGDPNQKIILSETTDDVRSAVMQISGQMLPQFVYQDKLDLRNTIHAILGTPQQFTGAGSNDSSAPLGKDIMVKNQASARQDQIVRAIERALDKYFNLLTQMMLVWYDEDHDITVDGGDGKFDFISMHQNKIDPKSSVTIRAGSFLPMDKQREQAIALNLSNADKLSPYDVYVMLDMPNPQKLYDNWMKYKTDAASLASEIDKQMADRSAYIEFVEIMDGQKVEVPDDVSPDHLMAHAKQMTSDEFTNAPTKAQRALVKLVSAENDSLKRRTEMEALMESSIQQDMQTPQQPQALPAGLPPGPGGMPGGMPGMMPPGMGQPPMGMGAPMPQGAPPVGIGQVMSGAPIAPQPQMGNPAALPGI